MSRVPLYLYGKNPLLEALRHAPQVIREVFVDSTLRDDAFWKELARLKMAPKALRQRDAERMAGSAVHQGVIAEYDPDGLLRPLDSLPFILAPTPDTALVVLGELTDPQNVGAIIRSAAAFGASAVLIPEHNQASLTGTVIKASAGMAFRIPLVRIGNVNMTLRKLKENGFWVYGLAMEGAYEVGKEQFTHPAVFVVGSEGAGLREKTREHCDITLTVPMHDRAESLNASVAAAVCLYEWSRQHPSAL